MPNMNGPDAIWSRKGAKYKGKYLVDKSACPLVYIVQFDKAISLFCSNFMTGL